MFVCVVLLLGELCVIVIVLICWCVVEFVCMFEYFFGLFDWLVIVVVDNVVDVEMVILICECFVYVVFVYVLGNFGVVGCNFGVVVVCMCYVVFCDDDMWWVLGFIVEVVNLFDVYLYVVVVIVCVLVGFDECEDLICWLMVDSLFDVFVVLLGCLIFGLLVGVIVFWSDVFVCVGGYYLCYFFGGEEVLFVFDLMCVGYWFVYVLGLMVYYYLLMWCDWLICVCIVVCNVVWIVWFRWLVVVVWCYMVCMLLLLCCECVVVCMFVGLLWILCE